MKKTSPSLPDGFKTQACPLAANTTGLEAHTGPGVPNLPAGWSAETCFRVRIKEERRRRQEKFGTRGVRLCAQME